MRRGAHERLQRSPKIQNADGHLRSEASRKRRRASSLEGKGGGGGEEEGAGERREVSERGVTMLFRV
jgi:hypothetical protein